MPENGGAKVVSSITCPVCLHRKTPPQRALVCGECAHEKTEIIRNSVVENEAWNRQMRAQIDWIFGVCEGLNRGQIDVCDSVFPPEKARNLASVTERMDIPQPGKASICSLALHLQKLETVNRKMKGHGLQRSRDTLLRKNRALDSKIESLEAKLEENRRQISKREAAMLEEYSRKLERIDRDIVSVQLEGMRRISRQAALSQYTSYKVIRERYFIWKRPSIDPKTELTFCDRPVLQLSSFLERPIITVNTFLEDLIRLQIVLFDLFKIDDETLELPYLESLKKLLPDRHFYDSVQKKIYSILQKDDHGTSISDSNRRELDISPDVGDTSNLRDYEKITIKDNTIHIPKSFRTMNLQRRSSAKEASDENLAPESDHRNSDGNKSTFVMVPQESMRDDDISPKSSARSPSRDTKTREGSFHPNGQHINGNTPKLDGQKHDLEGKKIVIVPHRILTKPFSKLRPNEYLKFVSIVVKILITLNDFLVKTIGPFSRDSPLLNSTSLRPKPEGEAERVRFVYNIQEILSTIANMDTYFEKKLDAQFQTPEGTPKISSISTSIDNSQLTTITEESKSVRESWTSDPDAPTAAAPLPHFQTLRDFYTKFMRNRGPERKPETTSMSDNIIYGMVSETQTEAGKKTGRKEKEKEKEIAAEVRQPQAYDLKEISRNVHDIISGRASGQARAGGLAHLDRAAAKSVMQQSRAHLEDWDVVSKMF